MSTTKIPTSFRVLGHTIKVHRVAPERWKTPECHAFFEADKHRILIRDSGGTLPGHSFYHELVHAILSAMGHPLNSDESIVDNFSGLLHQALSSAKYPQAAREVARVKNRRK